jgi:DNA primase
MKPPDFLKNLSAPAQMLFRPMLMISLVLHSVVLMLPMPSDREKPEPPKKEVRVKIAQLPTTRPSPKTSPQSSSKPNSQSTLQPSLSTPPDRPTRPESVTTRQESVVSLLPLPESSSPLQQQSKYKKEEPQPQLTQQPRRSLSTEQPRRSESTKKPTLSQSTKEPTLSQSTKEPTLSQSTKQPTPSPSTEQPTPSPSTEQPTPSPSTEQPTPSPSTEQPTPSPSTEQPTPSPSTEQPTPSPSTEEAKVNNEATGGSYTESFNKYENQLFFEAALEEVKRKYSEEKIKQFKTDQDINKLTEANKFKDANGSPDTKFEFLKKAVSPLTTQDITSSLETQLSSQKFGFNKIGTYGGGPLYEVTKGDFKRYLIFVPGKDEQGELTAIVVSKDYPRE